MSLLLQLILSLPQVEACAVGLHEGSRLLAFVVTSTSGDQKADSPLTSVQQHAELTPAAEHREDLPSSARRHQEETDGADGDLSRLVLSQLSLLLPPHSVPDTLVPVPALCLTPHGEHHAQSSLRRDWLEDWFSYPYVCFMAGKVDMEALMNIYQRQRRCLESDSSRRDVTKLKQTLLSMWQVFRYIITIQLLTLIQFVSWIHLNLTIYQQETLGLPKDATVDEESNFLLSGGDSLKALHLCEDILTAVGVKSPELLEVLLDGTFSDVLRHVARVGLILPPDNSRSALPEAQKRPNDAPVVAPAKRERTESTAAEETWAVKVIRRAGERTDLKVRNPETHTSFQADALGEEDSRKRRCVGALGLSLSWSSDTGRCVDASPVLLVQSRTGQRSDEGKTTVFIGSHSHRIQALDLITGSLLWERVLGDRIEASAAVSHCGSLVVVGQCRRSRVLCEHI